MFAPQFAYARSGKVNWRSLVVLCALSFSDAVQGTILWAFLPFAVRFFGKPSNETAFWVGVLTSCFFAAQAATTPLWGWASDQFGRRPVLLVGLFGTCISMLSFAFAPTFEFACASRFLAGALNGNLAVTKTYITEISDSVSVARGFSTLSFTWGAALLVTPVISGALYDPITQYPGIFTSAAFARFPPFLLPCLFSAAYSMFALGVGWTLLLETGAFERRKAAENAEAAAALDPSSSDLKPHSPNSRATAAEAAGIEVCAGVAPRLSELLADHTVVAAILLYSLMSAAQITFDDLNPTLMQMAMDAGGLGLSNRAISAAQFVAGAVYLGSQLTFIPGVMNARGAAHCFRCGMAATALLALVPLCNQAPDSTAFFCVLSFMVLRSVANSFSFTSMNVLTGAASRGRGLGLVNGAAMSAGAITRAVMPTFAGALFSVSLSWESLGSLRFFVAYSLVTLAAVAAFALSLKLPPWLGAAVDSKKATVDLCEDGACVQGRETSLGVSDCDSPLAVLVSIPPTASADPSSCIQTTERDEGAALEKRGTFSGAISKPLQQVLPVLPARTPDDSSSRHR